MDYPSGGRSRCDAAPGMGQWVALVTRQRPCTVTDTVTSGMMMLVCTGEGAPIVRVAVTTIS